MILALSGVFIVATIMLCTNPNKAYEKKKHFNSPNEIIEVINNKQLGALDKDHVFITTSDFNECLSKRKRVTESNLNYYKIDGDILPEKNTKENKDLIIEDYKKRIRHLGYVIPDKVEALTLTGKGYHIGDLYIQDKEIEYNTPENIDVSIVFIDEGEGWVIDTFWISRDKEGREDVLYQQ